MKERPILFSAPMVRALLAGTKTQTRRRIAIPKRGAFVIRGDDEREDGGPWWPYQSDDGESDLCDDGCEHRMSCPYGVPGDRLWVREAWRAPTSCDHLPPRSIADSEGRRFVADEVTGPDAGYGRFRQGMFMPRWASRILLEVTAVRVERLQDISEADARAEGCEAIDDGIWWKNYTYPLGFDGKPTLVVGYRTAKESYRSLWEQINGHGSWEASPWVWVVEFRALGSSGEKS